MDNFQQPHNPEITLPFGYFKMLDPLRKAWIADISDEFEIVAAVKSCDPSKSPRYDGFNIKFMLSN